MSEEISTMDSNGIDMLAPIPGVPAGRRIHDIPADWEERDSEAIVTAEDADILADAAFPTKLVGRFTRKMTPANRNKTNVYYVFIHSSEGSYYGALDWMINGPVSASYCIIVNEAGSEATQMVASKDIAWAGGTSYSNTYGIHICMAGYGSKGFSDSCLKATAAWAKYFANAYEIPVRFASDIGASTRRQLLRAGVAGHEHIPGANHTDPFTDSQPYHRNSWNRFIGLMQGGSSPTPVPKPPVSKITSIVLAEDAKKGRQVFAGSEAGGRKAVETLEDYGLKAQKKGEG